MSARPVKPWAIAHWGVVHAGGVLVDAELLGEAGARGRVLSSWEPGARVFRVRGGYVLLWSAPRAVEVRACPGVPLVRSGDVWTTAPLSAAESARLSPPAGALVRVRGGVAQVEALDAAVEPSEWLGLTGLRVVAVESLGEEPPRAALAVPPVEAPTRARYGPGVPEQSVEAAALLASLRGELPADPVQTGRGPAAARPSLRARLASFGAALRRWWQQAPEASPAAPAHAPARGQGAAAGKGTSALGAVAVLVGALGLLWNAPAGAAALAALFVPLALAAVGLGALVRSAVAGAAPRAVQGARSAPDFLERLVRGAWSWGLRALHWTRMSRLIGRRQAAYLHRMLELFERGELQEALRHAIPLGGPQAETARPLLGLPAPRQHLTLSPGATAATSVLDLGENLQSYLRRVYRQSAERLERGGRIDEAAFVYAELLHDSAEAVAFLERHGRLRLAAELAEGRNLPPGLVVRQWLLAGETERAVLLARRTGAFAEAIALLERKDVERAKALRLLWGEVLAEAGDWSRAVQVVRPLPEARGLLGAWLERAVAGGGPGGARMLALQAACFPELQAQVQERARAFLEADGAEAFEERRAFAAGLLEEKKQPELAGLARRTARALLRDRGEARPVGEAQLTELVARSGDFALRTDWPKVAALPAAVPLRARSTPLEVRVAADDAGTLPVTDAALLPGGRRLVALGEAGVRLLTPDGRTVAHLAVPAERLVVADGGARALALASRGELWRVSRLDLGARMHAPWFEGRLLHWADTYDGQAWFVAEAGRVLMLDALSAKYRALWHLPRMSLTVPPVRSAEGLVLLGWERDDAEGTWESPELWRYALPGPTLRQRTTVLPAKTPEEPGRILAGLAASTDGWWVYLLLQAQPGQDPGAPTLRQPLQLVARSPNSRVQVASGEAFGQPLGASILAVGAGLAVVAAPRDGALELFVYDVESLRLRARLVLEGTQQARVRLTSEALVVCDDRGRVLTLDLATGRVAQLRISP